MSVSAIDQILEGKKTDEKFPDVYYIYWVKQKTLSKIHEESISNAQSPKTIFKYHAK